MAVKIGMTCMWPGGEERQKERSLLFKSVNTQRVRQRGEKKREVTQKSW